MLQLGWKAGPAQYPPAELWNYVVVAEHAGFETIDVSDQRAFLERYGRDVLPKLRR